MRKAAGLMIAAVMLGAAATASAASAQPGQASDVDYLQASRCAGLAASGKVGTADPGALNAWIRGHAQGRSGYILERGDEMKTDAKRQANRAGDYERTKLSEELGGVCANFKG